MKLLFESEKILKIITKTRDLIQYNITQYHSTTLNITQEMYLPEPGNWPTTSENSQIKEQNETIKLLNLNEKIRMLQKKCKTLIMD